MQYERRKPKWYQWLMQFVVPGVILALVAWSANKQVTTGEKVAAISVTVATIQSAITRHDTDTVTASTKNAKLHHRPSIKRCANCHDDNGG